MLPGIVLSQEPGAWYMGTDTPGLYHIQSEIINFALTFLMVFWKESSPPQQEHSYLPWDTVEVAEERGFECSPESQMIFRSSYLVTISWGEESCAKKKKIS